jgi:hypothetical protein
MHPCYYILFYAMSGFIQMSKGIENHLKMYLEKSFQKMKREFFLSLFPPSQFGLLAHSFSWPARIFPSPSFLPCWAGPSVLVTDAAALSFLPSIANAPGTLVGFIPSSASHTAETKTAIPRPHSPRGGASHASDPI